MMEWYQILQAVLSLVFVIGLLLLVLWTFKYCEQKGLKCKLVKKLRNGQRLAVLEKRNIDAKNQLVLVRIDNEEYALLVGGNSSLLLKTNLLSGNKNDE
ncbi:MAG: hypothetical protein E7019_01290 [Alphaproteobacteria bacterium]|nr:hypothetical protein [Alphaproteobacteria bacterium]